jgi:hypothetical protein
MDKLTWYDNDGRIMCRRGYEVALARLASYEATGLTPEQVVNAKTIIETAFADDTSKAERIRKLVAADDEGRVTILPCRGDADIVLMRNGIAFKPDHWNIHLTAFAENQPTPSGKKVALFDLSEVQESMEGSTDV